MFVCNPSIGQQALIAGTIPIEIFHLASMRGTDCKHFNNPVHSAKISVRGTWGCIDVLQFTFCNLAHFASLVARTPRAVPSYRQPSIPRSLQ